MAVYTVGTWTVKPGQEAEFIDAWRAMAARTAEDFPGASAFLLQDRDLPQLFLSYGPWESLDQIQRWRASVTFRDGVESIRPFLDGFQPHTMNPVATTD